MATNGEWVMVVVTDKLGDVLKLDVMT